MKIFRYRQDGKLYYIEHIVKSMCLCLGCDNKYYAHAYKHNEFPFEVLKEDIDKKFKVIAEYNRLLY